MSLAIKRATNVIVLGAKLYRELALSALTLVKPPSASRRQA